MYRRAKVLPNIALHYQIAYDDQVVSHPIQSPDLAHARVFQTSRFTKGDFGKSIKSLCEEHHLPEVERLPGTFFCHHLAIMSFIGTIGAAQGRNPSGIDFS